MKMKSLCFHPTVNKIRKNVVCEYKSLFYLLSYSKSGIFLLMRKKLVSNSYQADALQTFWSDQTKQYLYLLSRALSSDHQSDWSHKVTLSQQCFVPVVSV